MVEHLVLFKLKEGTPQEEIDEMLDALRSLRESADGIVDLTTGPNTSDRSQGFSHGLVVRFADQEALEAYLPHPAHQKVVSENIMPILEDLIVVDYEF